MVNLKHISVTELIHDNVVGEFIDRLIDLKNLEKLELVGALQKTDKYLMVFKPWVGREVRTDRWSHA